jgi:diadenosine tetraphosphatase ApaH/serine/threonine PP2A family protein phosphatase
MRYAIFTDVHANLEALETVLAKIDELAQEEPIDQLWFLGDLVGYGPNPNECIAMLRERTDVIIAGNHDWAAVGKIDLEDFSEAARISAEWTMQQLTEEHRQFLIDLPERLEIGECTLVHGSPYGPLWEYLTSDVLAERSFQHFTTRFCFVGHTHVPVIFQQVDPVADVPTLPLSANGRETPLSDEKMDEAFELSDEDDETAEVVAVHQQVAQASTEQAVTESAQNAIANVADEVARLQQVQADDAPTPDMLAEDGQHDGEKLHAQEVEEHDEAPSTEEPALVDNATSSADEPPMKDDDEPLMKDDEDFFPSEENEQPIETTPEETIQSAEERLNEEIEELLTLLGLSQSMVNVTNEMLTPPEGEWQTPEGYRAIVNPGGVGQPRDGDPRASFMIYDTEQQKITFYRIPYPFETTQEKIIKAGLPRYLATRLAYGR